MSQTRNYITIEFTVDADVVETGRIMDDLIQYIQSNPNNRFIQASQRREVKMTQTETDTDINNDSEYGEDEMNYPPTLERQHALSDPPEAYEAAQFISLPTDAQMDAARAAFPGFTGDGEDIEWVQGGQQLADEIEETEGTECETEETDEISMSSNTESESECECECESDGEDYDDYWSARVNDQRYYLNFRVQWGKGNVMEILKESQDEGMFSSITGLRSGGIGKASAVIYKRALRTIGVYRDEAGEDGILRWTIGDETREFGYWNKTLKSFIIPPSEENVSYLQHFLSDQNQEE